MIPRLLALLLVAAACSDETATNDQPQPDAQGGSSGQGGKTGQGGKAGQAGQGGSAQGGAAGSGTSGQGGATGSGGSGGSAGQAGGAAGSGATKPPPPGQLSVRSTPWNPKNLAVGQVAALAERTDGVFLFGSLGMQFITGGDDAAHDESNKGWKGAAVLPAADGSGDWVVGLDDKGQLHRVENLAQLEPISDRYGLEKDVVSAIARADKSSIFAIPTGIAVADGQKVIRFDVGATSAVAGRAGQAAAATAAGVIVVDLAKQQSRTFPVPAASAVAFDEEGKLIIAAGNQLFAQKTPAPDAALQLIYEGDAPITGLVNAGLRTWFLSGGELGTTTGLLARTSGLKLPAAGLAPGTDGSIWVLAKEAPQRFAPGGTPDENDWYDRVLPVFAVSCSGSTCHTGKANNFSTYASWVTVRPKIIDRVGEKKNMPPSGYPLSDKDRAALVDWCKQTP